MKSENAAVQGTPDFEARASRSVTRRAEGRNAKGGQKKLAKLVPLSGSRAIGVKVNRRRVGCYSGGHNEKRSQGGAVTPPNPRHSCSLHACGSALAQDTRVRILEPVRSSFPRTGFGEIVTRWSQNSTSNARPAGSDRTAAGAAARSEPSEWHGPRQTVIRSWAKDAFTMLTNSKNVDLREPRFAPITQMANTVPDCAARPFQQNNARAESARKRNRQLEFYRRQRQCAHLAMAVFMRQKVQRRPSHIGAPRPRWMLSRVRVRCLGGVPIVAALIKQGGSCTRLRR